MNAIAFTGHRPPKLRGYNKSSNRKLLNALEVEIKEAIDKGFDTFITGMALGIDMWAGEIVADLRDYYGYDHIKLIAAVPFKGQETVWPPHSQDQWHVLISRCDEVHVLESEFTSYALQARNEWMVNRAQQLIAVWDGTSGGTGNCIRYADKQGVPYIRINPTDY